MSNSMLVTDYTFEFSRTCRSVSGLRFPFVLNITVVATSFSFLPHSSTLVARKMQVAAMSYDSINIIPPTFNRGTHPIIVIFDRVAHVESVKI